LFGPISRLDRLRGRIQIRKVWMRVDSANTDIYGGSHVRLMERPTDPAVSVIFFDSNDWDEHRSDLVDVIENYYQPTTVIGTAGLLFAAPVGAKDLTFKIAEVKRTRMWSSGMSWGGGHYYWYSSIDLSYTCDVKSGDTIFITQPGFTQFDEFLQVNKVTDISDYIVYTEDNQHYVTYRTATLMHPTTQPHVVSLIPYHTKKTANFHCFGTVVLAEPAAIGEHIISVVSTETRLVPTVTMVTDITGEKLIPVSTIMDDVMVGPPSQQWEIDGVQQVYMTTYKNTMLGAKAYGIQLTDHPVVSGTAGSIFIYIRINGRWVQCADDGAGLIVGDAAEGTINYITGFVSLSLTTAADPSTVMICIYKCVTNFDERLDNVVGSAGAFPVPLTFPDTNILPGSILLQYDYDGYDYQMQDDGFGNLIRNTRQLGTAFNSADFSALSLSSYLYGMACFNGVYFITSMDNNYSSTNGLNWAINGGAISTCYGRGIAMNPANNDMVKVAQYTTSYRLASLSGVWSSPSVPVPTNPINVTMDCAFFNGAFITAVNATRDIYTSPTGDVWTQRASVLPFVPSTYNAVLGTGADGDGVPMVLIATNSSIARSYDGLVWTSCVGATNTDVTKIAFNSSTRTWIVVGLSSEIYRSTDGYRFFSIKNKLPASYTSTPTPLHDVDTNNVSGWVVAGGVFGTHGGSFVQSNDNGDTWAVLGGTIPTGFNHPGGVVYNPLDQKWCFGILGNVDHRGVLMCTVQEVKYLPAGALGNIDYQSGVGGITAGLTPEASVLALYYLSNKTADTVTVHTSGGDPIVDNSFKIRARRLSDPESFMVIEEVGGVIVGDGTANLNKEAGYVIATFSEPYYPDSISVDYSYSMLGSPQPSAIHDGINVAALPVNGMVPAVQEGDVVILYDGVNEDAAVVMDVNQGLLTLSQELIHDYAAGTTIVSNAVVKEDLQAGYNTFFTQNSWDGTTWSNTQSGPPADGSYTEAGNITLQNAGSEKDRWAIEITKVTAPQDYEVRVVSEGRGVIDTDVPVGGTNPALAPNNLNYTLPYFTIASAFWGNDWQVGNIVRINTEEAGAPFWVMRVINAESSDTVADDAVIEIRGDI
jgi:hypothetical protein